MKYTVSDFVGPLTAEQRDTLDRVLKPGERILWATRPRVSIWPRPDGAKTELRLVGLVLFSFFLLLSADVLLTSLPMSRDTLSALDAGQGSWLRLGLLAVIQAIACNAFWLSGRSLWHILHFYLGVARKRRHTIYVLTDSQAITVCPGVDGWDAERFTLDEYIIHSRRSCRAGDELIFRMKPDCHTESACGWSALEDGDEAEAQIWAALAEQEDRVNNGVKG